VYGTKCIAHTIGEQAGRHHGLFALHDTTQYYPEDVDVDGADGLQQWDAHILESEGTTEREAFH
jgi:hypothetical protein